MALLTSPEEIYPAIALGTVHQLQEYARYTHSQFIGADGFCGRAFRPDALRSGRCGSGYLIEKHRA
ncbi:MULTISPECIES: hypothetical protein [unclassified Lysobacter]|uniref:hypothetical protein n=1 Tax=unclassified Lysobacter TaxID=2635362 RepID=UPI001BE63C5D|nr:MULTISPECIES: hypothetical protein [unclassified Lysobacter]MBT2746056.1 hypothetical protein [Lysobacter sp. ISL-42]MBT2752491.1 hypothetical protein [Lysobacter sp. ISL-50]MBT2776780.1 hypothetical protein [Lysobacter sp. ISL-54]MBT2780652.1 hypothetical protein [Lysobacter sp. ISL-52]